MVIHPRLVKGSYRVCSFLICPATRAKQGGMTRDTTEREKPGKLTESLSTTSIHPFHNIMNEIDVLMSRRRAVIYRLVQWEKIPTKSPEGSNERSLNILQLTEELAELEQKIKESK